jgi:hypothetical protein
MRINSSQMLAPKFRAAINLSSIWEPLRPANKEDRVTFSETQDQWIRAITSTMGQDDALVLEVCPSGTEAAFWVNGEERQLCESMFKAIENVKKTMPEAARQMACKVLFYLVSKTTGGTYGEAGVLGIRFFKNGQLEKEC